MYLRSLAGQAGLSNSDMDMAFCKTCAFFVFLQHEGYMQLPITSADIDHYQKKRSLC